MFIAALCLMVKKWEEPRYPSTDKLVDKLEDIQTGEYYLLLKGDESLIHATKWLNLENIVLSERSQSQKTYYMIPFVCDVQNG